MIYIKKIKAQDTWLIRQKVMWPDRPISFVMLEADAEGQHYGLFQDDQLCSVISLFVTKDTAQFRKLATLEQHQNKGYGTKILNHLISEAQKQKLKLIWCDARLATLPFYQKLGFELTCQSFLKYEALYCKIEKRLTTLD